MAVALTAVFCILNNRQLVIDPYKLYEIACDVAISDSKDRDNVQDKLVQVFKQNVQKLPDNY